MYSLYIPGIFLDVDPLFSPLLNLFFREKKVGCISVWMFTYFQCLQLLDDVSAIVLDFKCYMHLLCDKWSPQ